MTTNSQRNCSNNNNNNNNVANTSTNNNDNNEQNQAKPSSRVNNEMVMGVSQPNNEPINVSDEDAMHSQVQKIIVETSLPQNNVVSTTNTPPFSTTRPRHQRIKRDAILEIRQWNGVRPLVFDRITEGPPPGFEKKILSKE
ncbi:hypothetical protein JHK87_027866 [Glycine soja]|nr:hypothetical protein JHK87_027866 [Glycine soja]